MRNRTVKGLICELNWILGSGLEYDPGELAKLYSEIVVKLEELELLKARLAAGVSVYAFNLSGWETVEKFMHDEIPKPANATLILDNVVWL